MSIKFYIFSINIIKNMTYCCIKSLLYVVRLTNNRVSGTIYTCEKLYFNHIEIISKNSASYYQMFLKCFIYTKSIVNSLKLLFFLVPIIKMSSIANLVTKRCLSLIHNYINQSKKTIYYEIFIY